MLRCICFVLVFACPIAVTAQVHYHKDGRPWKQKVNRGPDREVPGWFYNLGITGIRAKLVQERPNALLIMHLMKTSPAASKLKVGDFIVSAGGKDFETPHRNGYGMDKFGPEGPILDFATALEACLSREGKGRLKLEVMRGEQRRKFELRLKSKIGQYSQSFPQDCPKSERILAQLCEYIAGHQQDDGSFGSEPINSFAPLALLASGKRKYLSAVKKNVRWHARVTGDGQLGGLINWRYMSAAIVMSEYYLATKERWVLKELQEVYDFIVWTQYTNLKQVKESVRDSHPDAYPKNSKAAHGGWGHNPGFEGYGPIAMLTGQGALAFSLMARCGIKIDRQLHDHAYAFLKRGSGKNGYVWYGDSVGGGPNDYADMGRTGAAGVAYSLSPYSDPEYRERGQLHAKVIGENPLSFPDTHGSPIMGMGYSAAAALFRPESFRSLMDANKWWFVLARCRDGSFYYQPNRDNAGYGPKSRLAASAATAFIFSLPKRTLHLSGKVSAK